MGQVLIYLYPMELLMVFLGHKIQKKMKKWVLLFLLIIQVSYCFGYCDYIGKSSSSVYMVLIGDSSCNMPKKFVENDKVVSISWERPRSAPECSYSALF